jgi:hypothetical protein
LLEQGILSLKEIPDTVPLTDRQKIQVQASQTGRVHVRQRALRQFLNEIKFPAHFLDFETVNPAIPIWDNTKCFEQTPFQFSLHIIEGWDAAPLHYGYLSDGQNDPRPEIIRSLARLIHPEGSILAYNAAFEIEVLKRCSGMFPEFQPWWESTQDRFIDLLQPFRNFDYYAPEQHGSASMKATLPVLCNVDYEDLAVQNGAAASQAFLRTTFDNVAPGEKTQIRKNLEAYCGRDTEGMIFILRELERLVES